MADTVKQIGIKQQDGTYSMKDIEVDYSNVAGLSTQATSAKAVGDKNNKDITTYVASGSHSGDNLVLTDGAGNTSNVDLSMTGATSNANGEAGFVPQPTSADVDKFLKADGTWDVPPGEEYIGSSNISIDSSTNAIDLTNTAVSSGTYGPSADVIGNNGTTISVPNISVDAKGRITNITNKTYTSVDTGSKVFTGSLQEWEQLTTEQKKTYDFISNEDPGGTQGTFPADRVSYDNTVSGLTATDVQEAVDEVVEEKTDKSDIAPEFNTTTAYAKGDLCYHEGTLYEFNQAHVAGAWNASHVDAKDIDDILRNYATVHYQNIHSVTANGVKTYKQLINELFDGYTSYVSLGRDVCVGINQSRYSLNYRSSTVYKFNCIDSSTSTLNIDNISYDASGSHTSTTYNTFSLKSTGITITDESSTVVDNGSVFRLYVRIRT